MAAGVEFLVTTMGFNADGNAVEIAGEPANRVYAFSGDFVITKDTSVSPNVIRVAVSAGVAALVARVAALESQLAGAGTLSCERIIVRTIEAKGTGMPPNMGVPDLRIIARQYPDLAEQDIFWATAGNSGDIELGGRCSWFGATTNKKQTLAPGYVVEDVVARLQNYNILEELP